MDEKEKQEHELHLIALTKEFYDIKIFHDLVCEEDEDHDLERSLAEAELATLIKEKIKGYDFWGFALDDRTDGTSIWGIMVQPDFETAKKLLQALPDKK